MHDPGTLLHHQWDFTPPTQGLYSTTHGTLLHQPMGLYSTTDGTLIHHLGTLLHHQWDFAPQPMGL